MIIGREEKESGGNKNNTGSDTTATVEPKWPLDRLNKTLGLTNCCFFFYWYQHLTKTRILTSCSEACIYTCQAVPLLTEENPDVTGVDKHVRTKPGASFASVPTHIRHSFSYFYRWFIIIARWIWSSYHSVCSFVCFSVTRAFQSTYSAAFFCKERNIILLFVGIKTGRIKM